MKTIAVVSSAGGAGKTTLSAALATLLARHGTPVVAVDLDPQNMLATHLGLDRQPPSGVARHVLEDNAFWHATTFRSADDVLFVPFGKVDCAGLAAFDAFVARQPDWMAGCLQDIALPEDALAVLDVARYPSASAAQALACADLVLGVVPPNPVACASLHGIVDARRAPGAVLRLVVNGLNPARTLHHDALVMLRECIGAPTVLSQRIHYDEAVPEAFARGAQVFDDAPHAQASHDLHGLANWLLAWTRGEQAHA